MNYELLKELEDLKQTQKGLSALLHTKIDAKVKQVTNDAFQDFEKFFNEKGFNVQKNTQSINATYGDLIITLECDNPKDPYLGCYFAYRLTSFLQEHAEYDILLIPQSRNRVSTSYITHQDPDGQLRQNIQQHKDSLEEMEKRFQDFSNEKWCFESQRTKPNKSNKITIYDSIYNLLAAL